MKYIMVIALIAYSSTGWAQRIDNNVPVNSVLPVYEPMHRGCGGGQGTSIPGARKTGTLYIIDGNPVRPVIVIPPMATSKPLPEPKFMPIRLMANEIRRMPATSVREIAALSPTVYQVRRGDDIQLPGGRPQDMLYVIDGMRIVRN